MIDGSKPLENPRYERFACELAKGSSQYVAYHEAGFTPNRGNATRLNANESVKARVAWIKEQSAVETILTIQEKRKFLAKVVRTPIGNVDQDSDLCQEFAKTADSIRFKMPDKLAAIRLDNDLAGDGSEAAAQLSSVQVLAQIMGVVK